MGNESVECRDFESDYHPRVLRIPVERRPMILSLELRVEPRMTCGFSMLWGWLRRLSLATQLPGMSCRN